MSEEAERDTSDNAGTSNMPTFDVPWYPISELKGLNLLRFKIKFHPKRFRRWKSHPFSLKSKPFDKYGSYVRLQEALTMHFIAQSTTIPVPRVLDIYSVKGRVHLIQERIEGPVLEDVWHLLSAEDRRSCIAQIKDYYTQLRALRPPHPARVQAVDGSGLMDSRIVNKVWGPFENHDQFHQFLNHETLRKNLDLYPLLEEPLSKVAGRGYRSVFSHGDFGPHNIIWSGGRAVVIDWEMSGWFPEYWEYTRAYAARGYFKAWWDMFEEVVQRYDDELELQTRISAYFASI